MEKKINQFERNDGYSPSVKCDNPIQEKWVHKKIVKVTGSGEDDFILDEKPFLIDSVDIHKSINEEAKTTDLKYLLKQLFMTGDESVLQKREGFFGDVSMFDEGHDLNNHAKINLEEIKESLPDEFKKLSDEEIARLSNEEIIEYFDKLRLSQSSGSSEEKKEG